MATREPTETLCGRAAGREVRLKLWHAPTISEDQLAMSLDEREGGLCALCQKAEQGRRQSLVK